MADQHPDHSTGGQENPVWGEQAFTVDFQGGQTLPCRGGSINAVPLTPDLQASFLDPASRWGLSYHVCRIHHEWVSGLSAATLPPSLAPALSFGPGGVTSPVSGEERVLLKLALPQRPLVPAGAMPWTAPSPGLLVG